MVGFKIKANIDSSKLRNIMAKKQDLIQKNIVTVLKRDAIPFLIERIMVGYDSLSDRAETGPDDPTNPARWRTEFLTKLEEDLSRTFVVEDNRISVNLGDKEFLGYDPSGVVDSGDATPLHWLVFYIEGLVGDWAFITPEVYERITGRKYKIEWGRFSDGFMISKEDYEAQGWDRVFPFDQVRHPFSGFSPVDIFAEALREFRLRPFVEKAIAAAMQGRKL